MQTSLQNDLSITLRDPFTFGPRQSVGAVETDAAPDDQCPRGLAAIDGDVCVLAVVRWKGQQIDLNVSTFANGKALRTGRAKDGALVVRVPPGATRHEGHRRLLDLSSLRLYTSADDAVVFEQAFDYVDGARTHQLSLIHI